MSLSKDKSGSKSLDIQRSIVRSLDARRSGFRSQHESLIMQHQLIEDTELFGLSRPSSMFIGDFAQSEAQKTRIVASLVADEMIYNGGKIAQQSYGGAILFADISGFTDLTERYSNMGKGGPSRLTQVLNSYIGAMVQEIMSNTGDILKFSGDAFLAMWKSSENAPMQEVVHSAIDTALNIQKSHGFHKTEVGVVLRVKIAVAAGTIYCSLVGKGNFIMIGNTIWDVKSTGDICGPGDIILAQSVLSYLNLAEWQLEKMTDNLHTKVLGIGSEWSPVQYSSQYERFGETDDKQSSSLMLQSIDSEDYNPFNTDEMNLTLHDYSLRPSMEFAVNNRLMDFLRSFAIAPVMRIIDMEEPLEYLTEMRQVIVVFLNVVTVKTSIEIFMGTANDINEIVQKHCHSYEGLVNKISMFDKDFMFLIIFGLRGFKHDLETQMALRCSKEILISLKKQQGVISASIGVTSGMTYCGVVGHPLRREYTVIGRVVNKAARLMCAYRNKVTCDQQTFLHSKLKASYFRLQEAKPLKGFKNVGPIYEFEEPTDLTVSLEENQFPLLGRSAELKKFNKFLLKCITRKQSEINAPAHKPDKSKVPSINIRKDTRRFEDDEPVNTLIIKGRPRQGKSYLLNELLELALPLVSVHKFALTGFDRKIPFRAIQCLFGPKIGLYEDLTIEQKTHKVAYFLKEIKVPHFLCSLNDILGLSFTENKYYSKLSDENKDLTRKKMMKYLCQKCFNNLSLIAIDSGENIDDESWYFLKEIIELDYIIIVITLGSIRKPTDLCKRVVQHQRVKTIELGEVDKWYQAGLICQVLQVQAIPLSLEKYVQDHSQGNPGWIESFITTLFQADHIYKSTATARWITENGYVRVQTSLIKKVGINGSGSKEKVSVELKKGVWDMYKNTYKDSDSNEFGESSLNEDDNSIQISIASLSKEFSLTEIMTEDVVDGEMMRKYDSLSLKEQLLLKSCSVLGNLFSREMLHFMLPSVSKVDIALMIKKLFVIEVLKCARGEFDGKYIHIVHQTTDPMFDNEIKCDCIGLAIDDSCMHLPKYANCGFMRFRDTKFRQMLSDLLTDNQMKQFHTRAIWYLENETRRCRACGGGFFFSLNDMYFDDGLRSGKKIKISKKKMTEAQMNIFTNFNPANVEVISSVESVRPTGSRPSAFYKTIFYRDKAERKSDVSERKTSSSGRMSKFVSFRPSDVRKFTGTHLINCECRLILTTMYSSLDIHCMEAELDTKLMNVILEYAELSAITYNLPMCFRLLQKAGDLLKNKLKYAFTDPEWQEPILQGRICVIEGHLLVVRSRFFDAEQKLLEAIKYYGVKFPSKDWKVRMEIRKQELIQKSKFSRRLADDDECMLFNFTSDAMSCLSDVYKKLHEWEKSYLAALWGLNEAMKADNNFFTLCKAYSRTIELAHYYGRTSDHLETNALKLCFRKETKMEIHELESIIRLYGAIFYNRCWRRTVSESLTIGNMILQLHPSLYISHFKWQLIPLLVWILVIKINIQQAVNLIKDVLFLSEDDSNYLGPMLFYSLCVDVRLAIGYCIVPFKKCVQYFRGNKMMRFPETITEYGFYVKLWLWFVRVQDWEAANVIYNYIKNVTDTNMTKNINPASILSDLQYLEGHLLSITKRINDHDHDCIQILKENIKAQFKRIYFYIDRLKLCSSRLIHLKAYWRAIFVYDSRVEKLLDAAEMSAKKHENILEVMSIQQSRKYWSMVRKTGVIVEDDTNESWKELSKTDHYIDKEYVDFETRVPTFILPLPVHRRTTIV